MDRLDLRILKVLLVNNGIPPGNPVLRKSFRSIAKDLGVDQATVRKRMKRFQEQRILRGWYLGVSPGVTGCDVVHAWIRVEGEDAKDDLIARLLSVPDIERACNYLGPKVSVVLFGRKGADNDKSLERLSKTIGTLGVLHKEGVVPVPVRNLKKTEAAIIANLSQDPWKSFGYMAKELRLSERTVKRVVTRLSEDGTIYMLPIIDLKSLQGIVPVELLVDYSSKEARTSVNKEVVSHMKDGLVFSNTSGPYGYFAVIVPVVSQVEQIERWARKLQGVEKARAEVLQDVVLNRKHYEEWGVILASAPEAQQIPVQSTRA